MTWKIKTISFAFLILTYSCGYDAQKADSEDVVKEFTYASTQYLIEPEDLQKRLNTGSKLKLIDVRKPVDFNAGHIANALNIWRNQITDTSYEYDGMMATKLQIEQLLCSLGITAKDTLILYDDKADVDAARLWWILKFYGHQNMKLLNGGLRSWMLIDSTLFQDMEMISQDVYEFENPIDSSVYTSFQSLKSSLEDSGIKLLDTRGADEFSGQKLKKGAAWPGHILGATNLDWAEAVDYNGNHKFLSPDQLKFKYEEVGITEGDAVVTYCHSGVRSAHTLFVLTQLLGYKNVRNYDGSWTEWSHLNPVGD